MNEEMKNQLLQMLSKMDKGELEKGLAKASGMLSKEDKDKILGVLGNQKK